MSKPDLFRQSKTAWMEEARREARRLLAHREYITSEDVTAICPLPRYLHPNITGGVFKHTDFQMVGVTLARRPSSNKRLIRKWALKNPTLRKSFSGVEYDRGD